MKMRDRIKQGYLFTDHCEGLDEDRLNAKKRMKAFNESNPEDIQARLDLLNEILGEPTTAWVEPPLYFCYGRNISIGKQSYLNFNCNLVDDTTISIGDHVLFGPSVTIATVGHPINPTMRSYMYASPVTIKNNCWIGANSVILPGVTIGENSVIGAGSVVTKDIPANCVAVGNPCHVLRYINEHDEQYYFKNRKITKEDLALEATLR